MMNTGRPAAALLGAAALTLLIATTGCTARSDLTIIFNGVLDGDEGSLKIRLRATELIDGVRPVANEIPSLVATAAELSIAGGLQLSIIPPVDHVLAGAAVLVEVLLANDDNIPVDSAFAALGDPNLRRQTCVTSDGTMMPCSHERLYGLDMVAAASFVLDRLGSSDAEVMLFALGPANDPDRDTFPAACPAAGSCDPRATDCNPDVIAVNPFEVEGATPGLCVDMLDQDCDGADGPCFDIDGDGYVEPEDCGEGDPAVNPDATENDKVGCSDGIDQDCDGADVDCACDLDGDGFCSTATGGLPGGDCCETLTDPGCPPGAMPELINPGVPELCGNGADENCDGSDVACQPADADGDGHCADAYGCNAAIDPICARMLAAVDTSSCSNFTDCVDWDSSIYPGADEDCGGDDRDCDGDPGSCPAGDMDGDGWEAGADCDDDDPDIHPGAGEICGNGTDDDCIGGDIACNASTDADGDTYVACTPGQDAGCDCDDDDPDIHPGATESCDGVDENCDGNIDDGNPDFNDAFLDPLPCYGNPIDDTSLEFVEVPLGICRIGVVACSSGAGTCILFARPAAVETCNGLNDTCTDWGQGMGVPNLPSDELDADGDGFMRGCMPMGVTGIDCCDGSGDPQCSAGQASMAADVYPMAPEVCSTAGVDNDCDGSTGDGGCPGPQSCTGGNTCECGTSTGPGDACTASYAPNCVAVGPSLACGCMDDVLCDSDESCSMGDCECGSTTGVMGPACPDTSPNPGCISSMCRCSAAAECDADESCDFALGRCECGPVFDFSGPACDDSGPNPFCGGSGCECDADSICGSNETCSAGGCSCGTTSAPAGEACPAGTPNPMCTGGACGCDGNSTCDADEACGAIGCECGTTAPVSGPACGTLPAAECIAGVCDCDGAGAGVPCAAGLTCDAMGACVAS